MSEEEFNEAPNALLTTLDPKIHKKIRLRVRVPRILAEVAFLVSHRLE